MRGFIGSDRDLPIEHQGSGKDLPSVTAEEAERNRKAREQREREEREAERERLRGIDAAIQERAQADRELRQRGASSTLYGNF